MFTLSSIERSVMKVRDTQSFRVFHRLLFFSTQFTRLDCLNTLMSHSPQSFCDVLRVPIDRLAIETIVDLNCLELECEQVLGFTFDSIPLLTQRVEQ